MSALELRPRIRKAAESLRKGGVVAYPTEAVWGLGCDPDNAHTLQRLLDLKKRDPDKGLILIAADIAMFAPYLQGLEPDLLTLLQNSWPGPITWLIPNNKRASNWVSGGRNTLALRVTAHPTAAALSRAFGGPLVSTSANPQGLPPAKSLMKVKAYFGDKLDAYTSGRTGQANKPTEIRDLISNAVIRAAS